MNKYLFVFFFGFLFTTSCENKSGSKPLEKDSVKEYHPNYEFTNLYLSNLGVEINIPLGFNMMDTSEVRELRDSLRWVDDARYYSFQMLLEDVMNNPGVFNLFIDTLNPNNSVFISGHRREKVDMKFLKYADSIIDLSFKNLKDNSLDLKTVSHELNFEKDANHPYGVIKRKVIINGMNLFLFQYFIESENMVLAITIRTKHPLGYKTMIQSLKMDF